MTKFETLKNDWKMAMKNKDVLRKEVLSNAIANVKNEAIANGEDRDNVKDATVDLILLREKNLLKTMIAEFPANATSKEHLALRQTYADKLAIVMEYAPHVIDDENEIRTLVVESGIELNKKNMGRFMGFLKGKKCDMGTANKVVTEMIEQASDGSQSG